MSIVIAARLPRPRALAPALALLALVLACDGAPDVVAPAAAAHGAHGAATSARKSGAPPSARVRRELAELRRATARFHRIERANAAGYDDVLTACMSDPSQGAMGVHVGDLGLFDDAVHHARPEILMYEPQRDGTMKLVGVEFAVPFAAWTRPEPPRLFGRSFHRNEDFGLWVLHAWVWRENPSGIFADWNPRVRCR